jgi:hypothetical protein
MDPRSMSLYNFSVVHVDISRQACVCVTLVRTLHVLDDGVIMCWIGVQTTWVTVLHSPDSTKRHKGCLELVMPHPDPL